MSESFYFMRKINVIAPVANTSCLKAQRECTYNAIAKDLNLHIKTIKKVIPLRFLFNINTIFFLLFQYSFSWKSFLSLSLSLSYSLTPLLFHLMFPSLFHFFSAVSRLADVPQYTTCNSISFLTLISSYTLGSVCMISMSIRRVYAYLFKKCV